MQEKVIVKMSDHDPDFYRRRQAAQYARATKVVEELQGPLGTSCEFQEAFENYERGVRMLVKRGSTTAGVDEFAIKANRIYLLTAFGRYFDDVLQCWRNAEPKREKRNTFKVIR